MRAHLFAIALVACGGSAEDKQLANPCAGVTGSCIPLCTDKTEKDIQGAFIRAKAGDTLAFCEGTYAFTNTLSLGAERVTIRGAGIDKTIFAFDGQVAGAEGIFAKDVGGLVFESFTIQNTRGDAIKVEGAIGITFRKVKAWWTRGPFKGNGAYGLYPVASKNVLIEDCFVSGASDAGIYVGQSEDIIVRRNTAENNVAGIEIENSYRSDVYENTATKNTAGILVFDLPGLPKKAGNTARVFKNKVLSNNTANFAPAGNIVGKVPKGTGMLVMANKDVEVFDNTLDDNGTFHIGIVSYYVTLDEEFKTKDPIYYPYPVQVYVHDNTMTKGGTAPDVVNQIGNVLKTSMGTFPQMRVPDVVYDGILDPMRTSAKMTMNPMDICVSIGAGNTFGNLDAENGGPGMGFPTAKFDIAPYSCKLAPLNEVKLP
jgi:parallel beta-helix repeat protein